MSQDLSAALYKAYTPLLDEAYKLASLTSKLDTSGELLRYTPGNREILVPKMTLQGLANYDRASGYVGGEAALTLETVAFNYERARMFLIDSMDNMETAGVAFGMLAGEFLRSYVVPEIDAFRFATYAGLAGTHPNDATINAAGWYAVITAAQVAMTEAEVPESDRHLFITATGHADVLNQATTASKVFFDSFASVTVVPQARFYEAISLTGSGAGGYARTTGANNINFMIIHKPSVVQVVKHQDAKIVRPEDNQTADAWKFGYRVYGLADVYDNKTKGVYLHTSQVTS